MSKLEDKIKALLEQSEGAVSEEELNEKFTKKDADQDGADKDEDSKDDSDESKDDDHKEPDADNAGGKSDDDEDDSDETKVSKENKVEVKEEVEKSEGINMQEHIDAILNGEELTEEFKSKVSNIFEAAVETAAKSRIEEAAEKFEAELVALKEEQQVQINEAVEAVRSELEEQIDGFLNVVVEQWVEDNRVALERGIQVELTNSFIDGLKNLFKEHYVEVPDSKVDVVEEQASRISELEATIEEAVEVAESLSEQVTALEKAAIVEQAAADLTAVEKEKFAGLTESVDFVSKDDFAAKVKTIKENYFGNKKTVTESVEVAPLVEGTMNAYVTALAKNLKF
jgi:hypothetical protein